MHLKEVQMENFKSFGQRLVVPFQPGFTAITGPNGSGKSNIGDAILFVLGPNSPRAIRAGRLTDLIFNGGEAGRPAKECTVSLVFDNADRTMPVDEDEVTLTRRVRRSPKKDDPEGYYSYFYVNGRASQKKQFVDLLNHARISADGYNITQQGDVLNICRMSNVERRKILDGIAGVTTFDQDIERARGRRTEVEDNLERIGIVLEEIERSLSQLEKEKEAAARYQQVQQEVQSTKGLMAWRRKEDLQEQVAEVQKQIARFSEEREALDGKLQTLRGRYKELQARFAETEAKIREEGGEEVQRLQEQIEAARDRMVRLEEKINYARMESKAAREEALPLEEELRRVRKEEARTTKVQEECSREHEEADGELAACRKESDALREKISRSDDGAMQVNRELARLKQEHEEKGLRLHEARLEGDRLRDRLQALEREEKAVQEQAEAAATDLEETTWQARQLREETQGSGKKRRGLQERQLALRKEQAELSKQNEDLEQRIRRMQRELAELQAQQEAAARAQGGLTRGVQEVLAARDAKSIKGIVGTIAELANVEARYQTALQVAAGATMQAVVVEDDGVAAQCIEILKRSRAGRAKFLPLSKMVPGRPRGQALMKVKQQGCLGFALDLIEYNPRYQNAFWHAFGDTLVVDSLQTGRRLMGGVRMVSLEGELLEASGAMVGGSLGRKGDGPSFTNADRSRIDALMQEIHQAESGQEGALERLTAVRSELHEVEEALSAEGRQDAGAGDRLKELERREEALRSRQASLEEELKRLAKEKAGKQEESGRQDEAVQGLEARLKELDALREEKGQLLLKGSKKEWRDRIEALDARARELQDRALKAENRRDVAAKQLELVRARVQEVEQSLASRREEQERHGKDLEQYQAALEKAKAEVDALMAMERKATGALKGLRDERDRLYKDLTGLKAQMDQTSDRMETHYGLVTNAKAKLPALEEALGEAMVDLKEHPVEVGPGDEVPPLEDLRRRLRSLEQQLERMGPVNMRALEEYEAQSERRAGLVDEVERLRAQREELMRLVEEISAKKKTAFLEVFDAIKENFAQVYGRLSLGGKAVMELEDPEDPFNGGLVLKAQPMGKRVTRLDALSGGEKSLTSMAFIFALQMHDPSPFYYLDEVDQNLDAVNSELLARMVADNARFAQFIVVSLRKVTLKEARHIYGVTQQQPGRSQVIAEFDIQQLPDEGKGGDPDSDEAPPDDDGETPDQDDGTLSETFRRMVEVKVER